MTFYAKPTNRPLALEGWFEKPKNRLFGQVRVKHNGAEAPNGPRPIVFKEWRDTRTFFNLKSTHCTLLILLIINLVTKKVCV
jgi:hypothetical protein